MDKNARLWWVMEGYWDFFEKFTISKWDYFESLPPSKDNASLSTNSITEMRVTTDKHLFIQD